jgi:uncharacterized iron-regulated membrane protein
MRAHNAGRLAALLLMLAGIALVGIITAAVAAWFVRGRDGQRWPDQGQLDLKVDGRHLHPLLKRKYR